MVRHNSLGHTRARKAYNAPRIPHTKELSSRCMHLLTFGDCRYYPNVLDQLLAEYGEVLTAPTYRPMEVTQHATV